MKKPKGQKTKRKTDRDVEMFCHGVEELLTKLKTRGTAGRAKKR